MIDSYWDLYVAYVHKCVEDNWKNDIDPAHYEMEWNHWLPKACFPDIKLGQYLTLKQHSIASALQSLAFNKNCMCGWHKQYLPDALSERAWPIFREAATERVKKVHAEKDEFGRSIHSMRMHAEKDEQGRSAHAVKNAEKIHAERDEKGRSLHTLRLHAEKDEQGRSVLGVKNSERLHAKKDEFGKSVAANKVHAEKDEFGRSMHAMRTLGKLHAERDEFGRSIHSMKVHAEKDEFGRSVHAMKLHADKDESGKSVVAVKAGQAAKRKIQRAVELVYIPTGEVSQYECIADAARDKNLNRSHLNAVCRGKRKSTGGFTARYL